MANTTRHLNPEQTVLIQTDLVRLVKHFNDTVGMVPWFTVEEDCGFDHVFECYNTNTPMAVWAGESHNTIWGEPRFNILFRALHDCIHAAFGADFTEEGEYETSRLQGVLCDEINAPFLKAVLDIETAGQVDYLKAHGEFPPQTFTADEMRRRGIIA